jgi:hypothetical protein
MNLVALPAFVGAVADFDIWMLHDGAHAAVDPVDAAPVSPAPDGAATTVDRDSSDPLSPHMLGVESGGNVGGLA